MLKEWSSERQVVPHSTREQYIHPEEYRAGTDLGNFRSDPNNFNLICRPHSNNFGLCMCRKIRQWLRNKVQQKPTYITS